MRAVIQRVSQAAVSVDGVVKGAIGPGLLLFLGVQDGDTTEDLAWLAGKVTSVRIFEDEFGKMNLSVRDTGGSVLVISQFTLFGTMKKGTRPSFNRAAAPEVATPLYEAFIARLSHELAQPVPSGTFGAMMEIEAHNDGPVTLVIDSRQREF